MTTRPSPLHMVTELTGKLQGASDTQAICLYLVSAHTDCIATASGALVLIAEEVPLVWFRQVAAIGKALDAKSQQIIQASLAAYARGDANGPTLLALYCGATKLYANTAGFPDGGHFLVVRTGDEAERTLKPLGVPKPGPLLDEAQLEGLARQAAGRK